MKKHDASHRQRLEDELVHLYRARRAHDTRGRLAMVMQTKAIRWAAGVAILALGVAACTTPTSTDVEMGKQIQFTLVPSEGGASPEIDTRAVVAELEARGLADVNVGYREDVDGATTVDLMVWGEGVDARAAIVALSERIPALADADVDVSPLETRVTEPLYAKLTRDVLRIEVGGESDAEIRAQILADLASRGIEGGQVDVRTEDGMTTIDMTIDDDGHQTHDVVELQLDGATTVEVPVGGDDDVTFTIEEVEKKN